MGDENIMSDMHKIHLHVFEMIHTTSSAKTSLSKHKMSISVECNAATTTHYPQNKLPHNLFNYIYFFCKWQEKNDRFASHAYLSYKSPLIKVLLPNSNSQTQTLLLTYVIYYVVYLTLSGPNPQMTSNYFYRPKYTKLTLI